MKNKEKYDLTKLDLIIQGNLLKLFDKDNAEKLFESEWQSYIVLTFNLLKWLEQEYIEPIILTEDEKAILRNLKGYKYIARDKGNDLYLYSEYPSKKEYCWSWVSGVSETIRMYNHLFQFVKWENEEPVNIDELLKQNRVER